MIKAFIIPVQTVYGGSEAVAQALNDIEAKGFRIIAVVPRHFSPGLNCLDVYARQEQERA